MQLVFMTLFFASYAKIRRTIFFILGFVNVTTVVKVKKNGVFR